MKGVVVALLLLLALPLAIACTVPYDGMIVESSVSFCSDVYYFDNGITINASDVVINCEGAVFNSFGGSTAITVQGADNVTVRGCRVVNYERGFFVWNASRVLLKDNHLVRNKVGTSFIGVTGSATLNHDISLQKPLEVVDSENNAISLTNKRVDGDFCESNFCNEDKSSVDRFMVPRTSLKEMSFILQEDITGKSRLELSDWVFSFFKN